MMIKEYRFAITLCPFPHGFYACDDYHSINHSIKIAPGELLIIMSAYDGVVSFVRAYNNSTQLHVDNMSMNGNWRDSFGIEHMLWILL